ncbi:heterokaryon incompatibility protein-domain-containing protein [Nemania sp. FL0916]|nr:heterokaryon incompatibility protein-domain-containing protein [Nemania sp. FL0916]
MATTIQFYRPLTVASREVRLLRVVHDSANCDDDESSSLQCSLEHMSLEPSPTEPYTAISYCWGADNKKSSMLIDGQSFEVPESASIALKNLVRPDGGLFWIDAICINQEDQQEKGRQVGMMKDIYSQAEEVRIWLGFLDDDVALRAIHSATKIYHQCLKVTNDTADLQAYLYGTDGSAGFKYSDEALPEDCDWEALRALYSLPWFTRLWVVQEIALARKAVCQIGVHSVPADTITLAARWMVHRRYPKHFDYDEVEGIENASSMYKPTLRSLSNQLRRMHRQRCADPRDRVYGLLGLLRPKVASAITPDYTLPLVNVYSSALRLAFEEDQNLNMLQLAAWYVEEPAPGVSGAGGMAQRLWSRVTGQGAVKDWPSWIPKLHGATDASLGSCLNIKSFENSTWPLELRTHQDPLVLSISGMVWSRITYVSDAFSKEDLRDKQRVSQIMLQILEYLNGSKTKERPSDFDDIILTLICGIDHNNRKAVVNDDLVSEYHEFIAWCRRAAEETLATGECNSPYPDFWYRISGSSTNRRFVVNENGLLAMAPLETQLSDYLCVFSGSGVPFVLRKNGKQWTLIGDAYCRRPVRDAGVDVVFGPAEHEGGFEWFDIC